MQIIDKVPKSVLLIVIGMLLALVVFLITKEECDTTSSQPLIELLHARNQERIRKDSVDNARREKEIQILTIAIPVKEKTYIKIYEKIPYSTDTARAIAFDTLLTK